MAYLQRAREAHERYGDQDARADTLLVSAMVMLEAGDKDAIELAIGKVKTALSGTDTQAIKDAAGELEKAFYAASEKLYSQVNPQGDGQGPGGGDPGEGPGGGSGGGDYYDADYEVVDDDDN